ncbi:MAG: TVP38/TMEM64 family protein [Gemmatimonadetes bacterium]|nr:TVP38/TMEM64 family protein [Gemmatimonadota bacterium]
MRLTRRLRPGPDDVVRLALLAVLSGILILALATDVFEDVTPPLVRSWVREAGVWAPAFYLAGFLVRPLTLVPLTLWLVTGGIAFGWMHAVLYAVAGVALGAAAVFFGSRALGRDYVVRILGRRARGSGRLPGSWGIRLILSLQLFPFMHHDLLNVAAGCSQIPYWRFLVGSSLGTLPGVVLYTYAGSVLMAPGSPQFFAAFGALGLLSLVSLAAGRRLRRPGGGEDDAGSDVALDAARELVGATDEVRDSVGGVAPSARGVPR